MMNDNTLHPNLLCTIVTSVWCLSIFVTYGHTLQHAHYLKMVHDHQRIPAIATKSTGNTIFLTTTPKWLNQTLDHFSPKEPVKFMQRYYEFLDYFDAPHGPIFLVVSGETTCNGILNDFIAILASKYGAAMVSLEHRYYGYSYPFSNLHTKNLQYFTSNQALSDLALFRIYYQDIINKKYNLPKEFENAWVTFGGSYAGALSAWFRLKFPHLAHASLASSAIIHAIEDFHEFDEHVAKSLGHDCTNALQAFKSLVNEQMKINATNVKSMFDALMIEENSDFLSLLADSTTLAVQYGFHGILCKPLVKSFRKGGNLLVRYQHFLKETIYGSFGVNPLDYNRQHIKNSINGGPGSGPRLWMYQICTEFGLFQTASMNNSIRFSQINKEYYLDLCSYLFGKGTRPNIIATNMFYGGNKIKGSKIIFTSGSQDPWQYATKQITTSYEPALVIECENCGHCVDLSGCPQFPFNPQGNSSLCAPQQGIDQARKLITEYIGLWINSRKA